ncbi:methylated-DNA--[protein]-cysteine S-methyltransferase [Catenovulum sp. 2E275]|uniref:bifunctional transcriptional activator/DNA repair enzyme AdaA n=1 Tax=Catenovulum sp. 2E275 TaxID=2980497 RepID=UPI0021D3ABA6|nr:methylated-DNA--[protein]-cysteine S-methyltransferase [Catenovulum sp. 2E275]MCU4674550.1 methylated-DNA--[protein]-cysteine S-methyltransferase [Catenovulum sp. 2E275]
MMIKTNHNADLASPESVDYYRIEQAIEYIQANFKQQPSLETIASAVNLSPYHFQRMFKTWAGVSPKKFIQYISLDYARLLLKQNQSVLDTAFETGLSSPSRLHELFINIEAMTPAEFKSGGANLTIFYSFWFSPFGQMLIASTVKGICHIQFNQNKAAALADLHKRFENAQFKFIQTEAHQAVATVFNQSSADLKQIKLHLAATPFQLKVWESLLKIPTATLSTYRDIAERIGKPKAARAVGSAIGQNPVAFLIPCHRVIQTSGHLGGYMWGLPKKSAIIGWEATR